MFNATSHSFKGSSATSGKTASHLHKMGLTPTCQKLFSAKKAPCQLLYPGLDNFPCSEGIKALRVSPTSLPAGTEQLSSLFLFGKTQLLNYATRVF